MVADRDSAGADLTDARLHVAELLGDARGCSIPFEPPARCGDGAEATERELEDTGPHLCPDAPALKRSPTQDPVPTTDASRKSFAYTS